MGYIEEQLKREFKVHQMSLKIKKLKSYYKKELSRKLGIAYFTLLGKINEHGGFSDEQIT